MRSANAAAASRVANNVRMIFPPRMLAGSLSSKAKKTTRPAVSAPACLGPAAARVADLFPPRGKLLYFFDMFVGEVLGFGQVVGKVVKLGLGLLLSFRLAGRRGERGHEFPRPVANAHTIALLNENLADRLVTFLAEQRRKNVETVRAGVVRQFSSEQRGTGGERVHVANQFVGHAGLDLARPAHQERDARAAFVRGSLLPAKRPVEGVAVVGLLIAVALDCVAVI